MDSSYRRYRKYQENRHRYKVDQIAAPIAMILVIGVIVRRHFNIGMNDILFLPFLMAKTTLISLHDTLLAVKRQLLVVL